MLQRSAHLNLELPPVWQLSQRIPRRRQIGILFGGNSLCAFASLVANASHAKDYQRDAAKGSRSQGGGRFEESKVRPIRRSTYTSETTSRRSPSHRLFLERSLSTSRS